jgi:hypothetical protein
VPDSHATPAPTPQPPVGAGLDPGASPRSASRDALLRNGFPGRGSRAADPSLGIPPSTSGGSALRVPAGTDCGLPVPAGNASSPGVAGGGATGAPRTHSRGAPEQAPSPSRDPYPREARGGEGLDPVQPGGAGRTGSGQVESPAQRRTPVSPAAPEATPSATGATAGTVPRPPIPGAVPAHKTSPLPPEALPPLGQRDGSGDSDGPAGPAGAHGGTQASGGGDASTTVPSPGDQERTEGKAPESLAERQARQKKAIRQAQADLAKQQRNWRGQPVRRRPGPQYGVGGNKRYPGGGSQ